MTETAPDPSLQAWARLTGFLYLLTNVTAALSFSASSQFMARNDAAQMAANIAASGTLFRLSIAGELVTVAGVIPLFVGLYLILRPVGPGLALLALCWRLMENCVLAAITLLSLAALAALARGPQHQEIAFALLGAHGFGFQIGFLFLGLGSTLFSWLWWKSRFIPRWLAGLGIFASAVMTLVALAIIVWPGVYARVTMAYMAPMGLYEIGLGLWLLIRGVDPGFIRAGARRSG